jgi:hypothetical protein
MWPGEDARRSTSEAGLSCCLELLAQGALRLRNLERQMQATSPPTSDKPYADRTTRRP